ncbi:monosaccharide-sensing protein 2-like isoform X2 [Punica granatum]|nr:monosaccharide-sensing protein 2-like isoform X2 [Punica granatum]
MRREFHLQPTPTIEGLIIATSLIGAALITTCSGALADWWGRIPMLILSSIFYLLSGLLMMWSPNIYILLFARLVEGFGVGLALTLVPLYISEMAPPEMRGLLNTLPQFIGSGGMFISYCIVFGMSMMESPNWRLMLGLLSIPSAIYLILIICFLPESPRWLISKGRMTEAKEVLQIMSRRENVSGEMALLVEGLRVGADTSLEKYIIGSTGDFADEPDVSDERDRIKLYGPEQDITWAAWPITAQSTFAFMSQYGSAETSKSGRFVDPLVSLFRNIHERFPEAGSMQSTLFPHLGSMFSVGGNQQRTEEEGDEETLAIEADEPPSDGNVDSDDNLQSPLISRQATSTERGLDAGMQQGFFTQETCDRVWPMGIGGGWHLAWKWAGTEALDGKKVEFKRLYFHQEGPLGTLRGPTLSISRGGGDPPEDVGPAKATALVSRPALSSEELMQLHPIGAAMAHPSEVVLKGLSWKDLTEPGVRHALVVGMGLQLLQQFSGINGVLYYMPQILERAGVGALLLDMGITSSSASLLVSAITTMLMLPSIAIAMRFMDISGRRSLLLGTIPFLIISLVVLVLTNILNMGSTACEAISIITIVLYVCFFVMGFGPTPNILCSEIFPTRVRGLCVALCGLTFWIGNAFVSYTMPLMLKSTGLAGTFGVFAAVCVVSWAFVFTKVPETKGMPLEVIVEFFSFGVKQAEDN